MVSTGGNPARTWVSGETSRAISARSLRLPSHASVKLPDDPGGPLNQADDVGDAIPVDDRGHLQFRHRGRAGGPGTVAVTGALAVETGRGGQHTGRERQMAAGRVAGQHDAVDVEVVLLGGG